MSIGGEVIVLHNIPPTVGSARLGRQALQQLRLGVSILDIAAQWTGTGVAKATIVNYLIDSMRTHGYTLEEVEDIAAACGYHDLEDLKPVIADILSTRDCTMRNVLDRLRDSGEFGDGPPLADVFNAIRLCIIDTCRLHLIADRVR